MKPLMYTIQFKENKWNCIFKNILMSIYVQVMPIYKFCQDGFEQAVTRVTRSNLGTTFQINTWSIWYKFRHSWRWLYIKMSELNFTAKYHYLALKSIKCPWIFGAYYLCRFLNCNYITISINMPFVRVSTKPNNVFCHIGNGFQGEI